MARTLPAAEYSGIPDRDDDGRASLIGWGLAATTSAAGWTRVAWSSPVPWWVLAVGGVAAASWPGRYSPRACAQRAVRAARARAGAADVDGPGRAPGQGRGRAAWAGVGVLVLAVGAATGRWWVLAAGLLVLAADAAWPLPRIDSRPGGAAAMTLLEVSSGGGAEGLAEWQADVLDRWYDGVRSVPALTLREDAEDADGDAPRELVAVAEVVDDDVRAIPGGVAFGVDTSAAMAIAEDVQESIPRLRRVLDAEVVLVEPVPARASVALLTVYRGQPFHGRPPVDWRTMRAATRREMVPVGETAHADLLAGPAGGVLSGRPALMSWRGSTSICAAPDMGKSALIRAYFRGLLVQDVPWIPVLLDNKGDYRALAGAAEAMGGVYVDDYPSMPDALDWAAGIGDARYLAQGDEYQHTPTLDAPLVVVVIAEWLDFVEWCRTSKGRGTTALDTAGRIVRRHRGSAVDLLTTWQASQVEGATKIRDYFPHAVALRVNKAAQVDMTLGDDSLKHGAHAHLIPRNAQGVFYAISRDTGTPYMGRAAWIPSQDQDAALIRPMRELGRRMHAARKENA